MAVALWDRHVAHPVDLAIVGFEYDQPADRDVCVKRIESIVPWGWETALLEGLRRATGGILLQEELRAPSLERRALTRKIAGRCFWLGLASRGALANC